MQTKPAVGKQPLAHSAISALKWNYAGYVVRSIVSLAVGVLLARLLGPKPYGQMAAASLVIGLASLISDAGFSSAFIQAKELTSDDIRIGFTFQILIAVALGLMTIGVAPLVAMSFHDPKIREVLFGISPVFFIQALGQTSIALMKRDLRFRAIQKIQISSYVGGYVGVGIPCALCGAGVWSIVAAQLTQSCLNSAIAYFYERHSVVPCLSRSAMHLFRFGSKVTANNIVCWGLSNLDNVIVGNAFGSTSLGFYNRAFTLASAPATGIVSASQQVLLAACSRSSQRKEVIRRAYLGFIAGIGIFAVPLFVGISTCSEELIRALLGTQWLPAIPLLRVLALAIIFDVFIACAGPVLSAMNQPQKELNAQSISLVIAFVLFSISARYSMNLLAWMVLLVYAIRFLIVLLPLHKLLEFRLFDFARALRGGAFLALVTVAVLYPSRLLPFRLQIPPVVFLMLAIPLSIIAAFISVAVWGEFLLAPELVFLLVSGSTKLPNSLVRMLERINGRQTARTLPLAAERREN